jgi:hypothetical protein
MGSNMSENLPFAVGCLFFEIPDAKVPAFDKMPAFDVATDEFLTPKQYVEKIRDALEEIPSIDNISITEPTSYVGSGSYSWMIAPQFGPHRVGPHPGGPPFPHFGNGYIGFDVHVPARMQEQLIFGRASSVGMEDFRVEIFFGIGFPVTYIVPILTSTEGLALSPSTMIVLVREFLVEEFRRRLKDSEVTFCFLGPSPLWADCYIEPGGDEKPLDYSIHRKRVGYNTLTFRYSRENFADALSAYRQIQNLTRRDLAAYYTLQNNQNQLHMKWSAIDEQLALLVELHRNIGVQSFAKRMLVGGRQSRQLMLKILDAEAESAIVIRRASETISSVRSGSELPAFLDWLEVQLEDMKGHEPPQIPRVVSFLDKAHERTSQTVVLLASSTLGGIVGAAITALVSK